ncbi:hypothetical protein FGO68_gene5161 [Halteria grandinella]|uniref:Uncharacterized protein n=1 Tax=Halteria grandinella TaxID=5974 RepID=A0A8J8NN24_HALGN|nr:hypothetical protein FGO68_gene5161 [Halteria grandinella]
MQPSPIHTDANPSSSALATMRLSSERMKEYGSLQQKKPVLISGNVVKPAALLSLYLNLTKMKMIELLYTTSGRLKILVSFHKFQIQNSNMLLADFSSYSDRDRSRMRGKTRSFQKEQHCLSLRQMHLAFLTATQVSLKLTICIYPYYQDDHQSLHAIL